MQKPAAITWLLKKIRKRIPCLALMTAFGAAESVLGVIFALSTRNVINSAVSGDKQGLVFEILKLLAVILGLIICFTVFRFLDAWLTAKLEMDWKKDIGNRIMAADYDKISSFHSAQLLTFLNEDVRVLNEGLITIVPGLTGMVIRIVSAFAVLVSIEPLLTLLLLLLGTLIVLLTGSVRNHIKSLNKAVTEAGGRVSGMFQEIFEKLIAVQAMNAEQELSRRADSLMGRKFALQKKRYFVSVMSGSSINALSYISGFAALVWCTFSLAAGKMNFGTLAAVTQLVSQIQVPFANLSGFIPRYTAMMAAAERLRNLEECCEVSEDKQPAEYSEVNEIVFENVSFSYNGSGKVLENCSFRIPRDSFVVLTGPSGIGKSTILRLLLHIFRPDEGKIYLATDAGDVPVSRGTRKSFAYVPQGNLLFSGTVRENICLTKPEATENEILRAAELSCMNDFLPELPRGLDTVLGENSQGLSEGQAQRLSIARAILSDSQVILLDEATSALDAETEKRVLENIRSIPGKTCIAVTHRPAAVNLSDIQLNFENRNMKIINRTEK